MSRPLRSITVSKLKRKIRSARTFSLPDLWLIFECWRELLRSKVALLVAPRAVIRDALRTTGARKRSHDKFSETALLESLKIAERNHVVSINCLPRAVALQRLLRKRGMSPSLRIGGRKEAGTFEAHAWLELDGRVINERPDITTLFPPLVMSENTLSSWVDSVKNR